MNPIAARRRRKAEKADAEREFFHRRRYLREDVTVFGEEMSELHLDTLTDRLEEDARDYYRYALESYERAKATLASAEAVDDLEPVSTALVDGRHQRACVLAMVAGEPLPPKRSECFFNPQHGPAHQTISWTPPGGTSRKVEVCAADANRLARGEKPDMRLVRVGDRYVPLAVMSDDDHDYGYLPPLDVLALRDHKRDARAQHAMMHGANLPGTNYGGGVGGGY